MVISLETKGRICGNNRMIQFAVHKHGNQKFIHQHNSFDIDCVHFNNRQVNLNYRAGLVKNKQQQRLYFS